MIECQPVSEFDAGHERRIKRGYRQTDKPDEGGSADHFDGPQPEAAMPEMVADVLHRLGTLLACLQRGEELANSRVRVERGERLEILVAPRPEAEACRRRHLWKSTPAASPPDAKAVRNDKSQRRYPGSSLEQRGGTVVLAFSRWM